MKLALVQATVSFFRSIQICLGVVTVALFATVVLGSLGVWTGLGILLCQIPISLLKGKANG